MQNLVIDAERLWGELMETAAIGGTPKGGICRLTLTDLDRQVREWFKARCEALGCTVTVDDMGAMFARRPGQRNDIPPIAMGSHLDTQPTGGKFDGVLGVLGALEALRTLVQAGYETYAPIEVINWTNEEGSRFAPAMVASGVFAGAFTRDWAVAREDREGVTFGAALDAIGYRGSQPCGQHPLSAFFELHIEQGPILEAEEKEVGIVTGVQGMRWYEVTVTGESAHTGATPMRLRKNALLGAARLVERINAIAERHKPDALGAVGLMEVRPNSRNVVPGEVFFCVDLRHPEAAVLDQLEAEYNASLERNLRSARPVGFLDAHLGSAAGALRCRLRRLGASCGGIVRLLVARDCFRRGARRSIYFPRRADRDDLRSMPQRCEPQRGGVLLQGTMRRGCASFVAGCAGL